MYIQMTASEINSFNTRNGSIDVDKGDGVYVTDAEYGVVLVFKKTDGTIIYTKTNMTVDPSSSDPNPVGFWSAFWDNAVLRTAKILDKTPSYAESMLKKLIYIGIIVVFIVYKKEVVQIVKDTTKNVQRVIENRR